MAERQQPTPPPSPLADQQENAKLKAEIEALRERMDAMAENASERLEWLEEMALTANTPESSEDGSDDGDSPPDLAPISYPTTLSTPGVRVIVDDEEAEQEPSGSAAVMEEWSQARAQTRREFAEFEERRARWRAAQGLPP